MNRLTIRQCHDGDFDLLAEMNKQLIEDEKHDNKMNIEELRERMSSFIHTEYNGYLFEQDGEAIGYALINTKRKPLYLRQFFIRRDVRIQKYGTEAYQLLLKTLKINVIDICVYNLFKGQFPKWRSDSQSFGILGAGKWEKCMGTKGL